MATTSTGWLTAAGVLLVATIAAPAAAQGRGNAFGKGRNSPPPTVTAAAGGSSSNSPSGAREFGSWLDDATLADPGSGWASIAFGSYFSPGGRQTDFPILDGSVGLTRKVQFAATVPYSRFNATDGGRSSGRGDVYLSAKIGLRDHASTRSRPGSAIAITPLIEVLSAPDPDGGRIFWALPVSAEVRLTHLRLYGSAGYFSRGVFFGGGAIEKPVSERVVMTSALTWTRSLADDPIADARGLGASRVDLTGGAAYALNSSFAVFGSIGRTLSQIDANSATLVLNTGLAFTFTGRPATTATTPPSPRR